MWKDLRIETKNVKCNTFMENSSVRISANFGEQGYGCFTINTGTDLINIMKKVDSGVKLTSDERFILLSTTLEVTMTNNQSTNLGILVSIFMRLKQEKTNVFKM